jgi:geranylgeranyl diphosphate synthase type II
MSRDDLSSIAHLSERIGLKAGLAFQIIDDVLDVTQSSSNLGKTAGKDTTQNKLTAVSLFGLEGASSRAQELTQDCINDLAQLQSKIFTLSNEKIEEKNFRAVLHFVKELLLRTS